MIQNTASMLRNVGNNSVIRAKNVMFDDGSPSLPLWFGYGSQGERQMLQRSERRTEVGIV
jgi:hypothetical protein